MQNLVRYDQFKKFICDYQQQKGKLLRSFYPLVFENYTQLNYDQGTVLPMQTF